MMIEVCCEAPGCSMPGTVCLACDQCLCWQHKSSSPCEVCQKRLTQGSFEQRMSRCLGVGISIFLCGILFFFLPQDDGRMVLQLAILFLVVGAMLAWLGLIAYASIRG